MSSESHPECKTGFSSVSIVLHSPGQTVGPPPSAVIWLMVSPEIKEKEGNIIFSVAPQILTITHLKEKKLSIISIGTRNCTCR